MPVLRIPVKTVALKRGFGTYVLSSKADRTRVFDLRLGKGLSRQGAWVRSVATNSFEVRFASGDRILWHEGDHPSVTLTFADGMAWRIDDVRELANIGSAHNIMLHGGPDADDFDTRGYARLVIGGGGGDTVQYHRGYGRLTIDEVDPEGPRDENVLELGMGLTPATTRVTRTPAGAILLDFGHGDVITMTGAMERTGKAAHGMRKVHFADGTVWTIGDLRYRLHPGTGAMRIGKMDPPESITTDLLEGGGSDRGEAEFTDPTGDTRHAVTLGKVVASTSLPPSLTQAKLLTMMEADLGNEDRNYTSGSIYWSFKGQDAFDYLPTGQNLTLVYTLLLSDNEGGRKPFDVPVTITGKHVTFLELYGSDVTVHYAIGRGDLEIEAADLPEDVHNTLAFGPGITPAMVGIEALPEPAGGGLRASDLVDSLRLTVPGSGRILLNQALRERSYGVQRVTFADGTVWSYAAMVARARLAHLPSWPYDGGVVLVGGAGPDVLDTKGAVHLVEGNGGGDSFLYDRGYGPLEIIENDWTNRVEKGWKPNRLSLGAGIAPADISVRMTGMGSFELSLGHGDLIIFHGSYGIYGPTDAFPEYHGKFTVDLGGWFGIDEVAFADGTRWSYADLIARQVPSNGVFYGVSGESTLDTQGKTHMIASEGMADHIVYKRGYGPLSIAELAPEPGPSFPAHNVIVFGPGIASGDLHPSTSGQDLCLWIGGEDMITIGNALSGAPGQGLRWGIGAFQFADGTSLSYADMLTRARAADATQSKAARSAVHALAMGWPITAPYPGCTVPHTSK